MEGALGDSVGPAWRGLLLTDIEGSTAHLRALRDQFAPTLARHFELLQAAVSAEDGVAIGSEGDSLTTVHPTAAHALRAAVAAQRALADEAWPGEPWRVRMAVHAGEVTLHGTTAVGLAIHEAARIRDAAHGGQVLVSEAARADLAPAALDGLRDLGLHHVRDVGGDVRLFQATAADGIEEFPPLRTPPRSNVPVALTSFVGRGEEIETVSTLLAERRLVTLVGVGGSGKTRLAYEVAGKQSAPSATAELAQLTDAGQVAIAIAAVVGARSPEEIATAIGSKHLVLVLDNCEHVLGGVVPAVASLLAACAGLRVLCTSREPLTVSGEMTFPVPPLSTSASIELFLDRAPRWLDDVDRTVIESICDRLAGIPLAIELAAARLRSIDADELARRLDDQLALLTGGHRDVPRQQTMRATLDWSHALLSDDERVALRRLSVFAGGWTLPAAEAVASGLGAVHVLDALDGLVQRSLVLYDPATARYRMLEPVRQYAQEQLVAAGERDDVRRAHATWALALATEGSHQMFLDQARWTLLLDAEAANHAAAISGALAAGDTEQANDIVAALAWYWFTAQRGEGIVWIERMLEYLDDLTPLGRARAQLSAAIMYCDVILDERPVAWLAEATATFREAGRRRALGSCLFWGGRANAVRNRAEVARALFAEGVPLHEELGDHFGHGWCLLWAGILARNVDGDLERAQAVFDEVAELAERTGVLHVLGAVHAERSECLAQLDDFDAALASATECIEIFRTVGDRWQLLGALLRRASYRMQQDGGLPDAAGDLVEGLDLAIALRSTVDARYAVSFTAAALFLAGRFDEASELVGATGGTTDWVPEIATSESSRARVVLFTWFTDPEGAEARERGARMDLWTAAEQARAAAFSLAAGSPA